VTLVTIAASYGAGGSRVAPDVARRLGVPFLARPPVPELLGDDEEQAADERLGTGGLLSRLASMAVSWGTPAGLTAEELLPDEARRRELEREVHDFAAAGAGVVLGRGAAVLLREHPGVLHVLLDGPVDARVRQAMAMEGIDRRTAERRLARMDRFRRAYMEVLYGVDPREPGVFHLVLDSTAIALADCVEIIAETARRRAG
jgi:Cytidylate kinase-like family